MEVRPLEKRSTRSGEAIAFTAVLLAFTLVLLASTFGLRASSALVPRVVGIPLAALLAYRLLREMSGRAPRMDGDRRQAHDPERRSVDLDGRPSRSVDLDGESSRSVDLDGKPRQRPDEVGAILWLLALPAAATVLGFVAGPALYVFAWARYRAGERMIVAATAASLTAVAIFFLFARLLGAPLWQGLLGALV